MLCLDMRWAHITGDLNAAVIIDTRPGGAVAGATRLALVRFGRLFVPGTHRLGRTASV